MPGADEAHGDGLGTLADFVATTVYDDLPSSVVSAAHRHLLDTLGAGIAGSRSREAEAALATMNGEQGQAAVWGRGLRLAPRSAALVNGIACHALELDDTGGCDHSGAVVFPAALSAAAAISAPTSGRVLLTAAVLGYDIGRRVLEACGGYEQHNEAGWHSTGTCGVFAAAATSAVILGLPPDHVRSALGIAASSAAGTWAFVHDGAMTKRLHVGRAAELGLHAAQLAGSGMTGPSSAFRSDAWGGFLSTYAPAAARPAALVDALGTNWKIMRCSLKPYASCRGTHAAVDAVIALTAGLRVLDADVKRVIVRLSPFQHGMCAGRDVTTVPSAQMSLPYAVASQLVFGDVGIASLDAERRLAARIRDAMDRIDVTADSTMEPDEEPHVTVIARDGRRADAQITSPLGSPRNPMTDSQVFGKFEELASRVLPASAVANLQATAADLVSLDDVHGTVSELLAAGPPLGKINDYRQNAGIRS